MNRRELLAAIGVGLPYSTALVYGIDALPKPYDPVAVLEAMRERKHAPTVFTAPLANGWNVSLGSAPAKFFPDFPSAVRWLHAQAAAADPTFAQQWPVPE